MTASRKMKLDPEGAHPASPGSDTAALAGQPPTREQLLKEIDRLRSRLEEAEQTLQAIPRDEVGAFIVHGPGGEQVYSLDDVQRICRTIVETMNEAAADFIRYIETQWKEFGQSRAKAEESEARFRTMADGLPFMIWVHGPDGGQQFVNRTFCEFFGLREGALRGGRWKMMLHPEDADAYLNEFDACLRERKPFQAQVRVKNAAGEWRWVESFGQPRFSEEGDFLGLVGASPDVTDRRRAEEKAKRKEERLRLLFETGALLLEAENPRVLVEEIAHRVMKHLDCGFFFNFLADEETGRLELNACAGATAETVQAIRFLDYGTAVCGCVARDRMSITSGDILNTPDPRTDLIRGFGVQAYCCHPLIAHGKLFGTLSFGTAARPHFTPEEVELMRTVAGQVAVAMERLKAREALEITIEERTVRLTSAYRELESRAGQLRRLADELAMAEQRERKRLAQVLHDGLQQYLVALKLQAGDLSEIEGAGIGEAARRMESMLGEAIQMSRTLSAELSPPILYERGLFAAIQWFAGTMREMHGFEVSCAAERDVELPEDVSVLLFQSVKELLFNAVKHSGAAAAAVRLEADEARLRITVSDSGVGFDPQALNSGEGQSDGFGIFSIRERLALLDGSLEIRSEIGSGSRLTLELPHKAKMREKAPPPEQPPSNRLLRVLIADDHTIFRDGLARICRKTPDIRVVGHAATGEEAVGMAGELRPDVVLMDIHMPGMDGIEAAAVIHERHPEIRIIGLSMYEDPHSIRLMREAGASDYKIKSSSVGELLSAIRRSGAGN